MKNSTTNEMWKKKQFQYHWHNLHPRALTYLSLILALLMLQYYFPYSQLSLWTNYTLLLSCRCYWKGQLLLLQINLVNYLDVAYHGQLKSYYWYYHYTVVIETEITLYFWMLSFSSPSALFNSEQSVSFYYRWNTTRWKN